MELADANRYYRWRDCIMPVDLLIENCAPAFAGIKTGNLFGYQCSRDEAINDLRNLNHMLLEKGLRAIPLRYRSGRVLMYIYRPARLKKDLENPIAEKILNSCGYPDTDPDMRVRYLITRLEVSGNFPHEIGLFLGYPPEDVDGFIRFSGCNSKFTGYWKVYGDPDKARECFGRYDRCRQAYRLSYKKGVSISQLAVKTAI
jgi:hypothetical protein